MSTCRYCERTIELDGDVWVDPDATGDDAVWRESCDAHDTFTAEHAPDPFASCMTIEEVLSAVLDTEPNDVGHMIETAADRIEAILDGRQ